MSGNHNVDDGGVFYNFANDLRSCFSEANGKKRADFYNGVLEYFGFGDLNFSFFFLYFFQTHIFFLDFPDGVERMHGDLPDSVHHLFEGSDGCELQIGREEDGGDDEKQAHEGSSSNIATWHLPIILTDIVTECVAISRDQVHVVSSGVCQDLVHRPCVLNIVIREGIVHRTHFHAEIEQRIQKTVCSPVYKYIGVDLIKRRVVLRIEN